MTSVRTVKKSTHIDNTAARRKRRRKIANFMLIYNPNKWELIVEKISSTAFISQLMNRYIL